MKSCRFHEFGKIENLKLEEIDVPEPGENEALIKLDYAALNPADRFLVMGRYPNPGKPPFAVGRDGCGVVEKAASGGKFKVGDSVIILRSQIGITREGTLAQYVAAPEESLAPLPEGWTPRDLVTSRERCFRRGLHILQRGQRFCKKAGKRAFLNHYASGYCDRGRKAVAKRWRSFDELRRKYPVPKKNAKKR